MVPPEVPMPRTNPYSYLAAAVVVGVMATTARRALDGGAAAQSSDGTGAPVCQEELGCPDPGTVEATIGAPVVTLEERQACRDVAYLCRGLEWKDGMARALRWSEETRLIRVRVPLPA